MPVSAVQYLLIALAATLSALRERQWLPLGRWAYDESMNDYPAKSGSKKGTEHRPPEVQWEPREMVTMRLPSALMDAVRAFASDRNENVHGAMVSLLSRALDELLEADEKNRLRDEIIKARLQSSPLLNG